MIVETKKMHPINQREIQKVYDKFESPEFEQIFSTGEDSWIREEEEK